MMRYEIKKVFTKSSGKIALLLLFAVFVITCGFAADVNYVNESGITESGPSAVLKLRAAKEQWNGVLDEEMIARVIKENRRIEATPEAASTNNAQSEIAYGWKQGFNGIRDLLNVSYAEGFREYDYYKADSLTPEQADRFYTNRTMLLKEWLEGEAKNQFSSEEKSFLLHRYETLDTPFYYEYMEGWVQLFEYAPTIIMITILILGYLVSGIFSGEFQYKTDAIFYSSYYGRNKAVGAKLKAGFCIVTVIYWAVFLLYSLFLLFYLGAGGAGCQIQADWWGYKSFYLITNLQAYFLIALGGYLGCIFISSLTMLVSAKTKSTVIAVLVPFILIFLPSFIGGLNMPIVNKIAGLLPDQLLQISTVLGLFNLYSLFGKVAGAVPVLFVLYLVLFVLLQPIIYRIYRLKQMR